MVKLLVALNIITASLVPTLIFSYQKYPSGNLSIATDVVVIFWIGLAVSNIASVFVFWKRGRFLAFYPFIVFVSVSMLGFHIQRYATQAMLEGTPCTPESFPRGQAKNDLEKAATQLVGQPFKRIYIPPQGLVEMIAGHFPQPAPPDIVSTLQRYGFSGVEIDDSQSLVTFSYLRLRTRYEYTYTIDKQVSLGSRPPIITEANIVDWSELIRIAKQGNRATTEEARKIVFTPSVVYPYLQQSLGQDQLDRFASYSSDQQISPEQQRLTLNALNQQWRPVYKLVENAEITYNSADQTLHVGGVSWDSYFWEVSLVKQLLSEGILEYAGDRSHLKIRNNLSPGDQNRVAWLHVGLMNSLYGNLFKKQEHFTDKYLGDGWYFRVE